MRSKTLLFFGLVTAGMAQANWPVAPSPTTVDTPKPTSMATPKPTTVDTPKAPPSVKPTTVVDPSLSGDEPFVDPSLSGDEPEELTIEAPTDAGDRRRTHVDTTYNVGYSDSPSSSPAGPSSPGLVQRMQNLVNFLEMFKDTPQYAEIFSLVMSNSLLREGVMNGRRRVEADAGRPEVQQRRLGPLYDPGEEVNDHGAPKRSPSPGLVEQVQNLLNFMEAFKDHPELVSLFMSNSMLRESVMNGRRRADAERTNPEQRRVPGLLIFDPNGDYNERQGRGSENASPGLVEQMQNLVNFMEAFKDHPEFAEFFSMVMSNSLFRESVMNGRRLEGEELPETEASQLELDSEEQPQAEGEKRRRLAGAGKKRGRPIPRRLREA